MMCVCLPFSQDKNRMERDQKKKFRNNLKGANVCQLTFGSVNQNVLPLPS